MRRWAIGGGIALALALLAWGSLHPDFRPDAQAISPSLRKELERTGFRSTQGISAARFEIVESLEGERDDWDSRQRIAPVDSLFTEKLTLRRAKGLSQEASGLYVGPLAVVRFRRNRPPFLADLLPYHFWTSERISDFTVEENDRFPGAKGGKMLARITYEEHFADGKLAVKERRRLHCEVAEVVAAASVDPRLSGSAARVECRETLEPDGRLVGPGNTQTVFIGDIRYAHWYIQDRGWSIAAEGEETGHMESHAAVRRWKSRLMSFD